MGSYVPSTLKERGEMLEVLGLSDIKELYKDLPEEVLLNRELNLPEGLSEMEVRSVMEKTAAQNRVFPTIFRGAGAYRHYIPSIVKYIPAKEEFLTSYTPYQAEISQGVLQSIFEYQTNMCELMGIFVVAVSALRAFWHYVRGLITHVPQDVKFELANGLATSLEFKMAAEILKTVLVRDLNELIILGAVVLLRALLSLLIHFEMKAHQ